MRRGGHHRLQPRGLFRPYALISYLSSLIPQESEPPRCPWRTTRRRLFGLPADCDWMRRCETSEGQACFCTSRNDRPWLTLKCLAPPSECEARSSIPCSSCTNTIGSFRPCLAAEPAGLGGAGRRWPFSFPLLSNLLYCTLQTPFCESNLSRNFRDPLPADWHGSCSHDGELLQCGAGIMAGNAVRQRRGNMRSGRLFADLGPNGVQLNWGDRHETIGICRDDDSEFCRRHDSHPSWPRRRTKSLRDVGGKRNGRSIASSFPEWLWRKLHGARPQLAKQRVALLQGLPRLIVDDAVGRTCRPTARLSAASAISRDGRDAPGDCVPLSRPTTC